MKMPATPLGAIAPSNNGPSGAGGSAGTPTPEAVAELVYELRAHCHAALVGNPATWGRADIAKLFKAVDRAAALLEAQLEQIEAQRTVGQQLFRACQHAEAEAARLRKGYAECFEDLQCWAAYAGDYFQQKHDLAGDIAKHNAALAAKGKD